MDRHELSRGEFSASVSLRCADGTQINCTSCTLRLTNQFLYIAGTPVTYTVVGRGDRTFQATRIPILHCQPHRFIQPWFGPYKWETRVSGPAPDSVEPQGFWTLCLTFSNGRAFEFREAFLRVYGERAQAAQNGMDEVLPAYSA